MSAAGGGGDFAAMVAAKNAENPVMIYSKTYCPCEPPPAGHAGNAWDVLPCTVAVCRTPSTICLPPTPASLLCFPTPTPPVDCTEVKSLFQGLGVAAKVIELDDLADGAQVQEAIQALTGRRTVPQASGGWGIAAGWRLC